MESITNEQWNIYIEKYGKLLWTIARKISGDDAVANVDDNYADLCVAAINSIHAFKKKTGQEISEFLETKLFGQYTKTVLWHYKAKKGVPLTNKMDFRNKHFSINGIGEDPDANFDIEDTKISDTSGVLVEDMFESKDDDVRKVIKAIINDPSVINSNGSLQVFSLIKPTGLTIHSVNRALEKIERTLSKYYKRDQNEATN